MNSTWDRTIGQLWRVADINDRHVTSGHLGLNLLRGEILDAGLGLLDELRNGLGGHQSPPIMEMFV